MNNWVKNETMVSNDWVKNEKTVQTKDWVKNETTEYQKHDLNQGFQVVAPSSNVIKY